MVVYEIIPDDAATIRSTAEKLSAKNINLVLFTGGTGLSPRDVTPDAIAPLIESADNGNHGNRSSLWAGGECHTRCCPVG